MTAPQLPAGHVVAGKYTVRSLLGTTGVSATYHAAGADGREVALKIFDPAIAQHPDVMKSIELAYATTNALPPNASAPIIDAGYDQQTAAPYGVTEILPFPSLVAIGRRLNQDEVATLLRGISRSVDLAHVRSVVHGAIKPTNVFFGPQGNPVVVTDFSANVPKGAIVTQEGFVNSAPWIAPEQAQGGAALTPAVDVFSAALLAFWCLTGRSFWRSCQQQAPDVAAWQQELMGERTPASQRGAEMGMPVSPALDQVFWRALSVDPAQRYHSIGELASAASDGLSRDTGNSSTMALPVFNEPQQAASPPPAAGAPPAYPQQQQPPQAQPLPQQGGMDYGGGAAAGGMAGAPPQQGAEAGAGAPPLPGPQVASAQPGMPPPPAKKQNRILPIAAVSVVALLGAAVAIWVVAKPDAPEESPDAPVDVATTSQAEPATTEEPETPEEPDEPEVTKVQVKVYCDPSCDKIELDGEELDMTEDLYLEPGDYEMEAFKAGHTTEKKKVKVGADAELVETTFELKKPVVGGNWKPPKPEKKCGQFLKRCD